MKLQTPLNAYFNLQSPRAGRRFERREKRRALMRGEKPRKDLPTSKYKTLLDSQFGQGPILSGAQNTRKLQSHLTQVGTEKAEWS